MKALFAAVLLLSCVQAHAAPVIEATVINVIVQMEDARQDDPIKRHEACQKTLDAAYCFRFIALKNMSAAKIRACDAIGRSRHFGLQTPEFNGCLNTIGNSRVPAKAILTCADSSITELTPCLRGYVSAYGH